MDGGESALANLIGDTIVIIKGSVSGALEFPHPNATVGATIEEEVECESGLECEGDGAATIGSGDGASLNAISGLNGRLGTGMGGEYGAVEFEEAMMPLADSLPPHGCPAGDVEEVSAERILAAEGSGMWHDGRYQCSG